MDILKNNFKTLLILTLLSYTPIAISQDSTRFEFIPKFHPTSLVIYRPTIMGGGEIILFSKVGVDFAYGQQYLFNSGIDTSFVKPTGNRMKVSIKYALRNGFHLGCSYWTIFSQDNYENWNSDDSFSMVENISVYTVDFGYRFNYKRLVLEGLISTGIRHKEREVNNSHRFLETMDTWPNGYWGYFPYKGDLLQFNISIRVGYSLIRL